MDPRRSIDRGRGATVGAAVVVALAMQPTATAADSVAPFPVEIEREVAADAAPSLPLPRMPGMTKLSSSAEFDAATNTWKLEAAFRVNAHVPHVLAFYRKALADAELVVEDVTPTSEDGPYVLLGKNDRVRAQVGVRTKPHELESRVWVLWRVRA